MQTGDQITRKESEGAIEEYLHNWVKEILLAFEQQEEIDLEEVLANIKHLESEVGKAFIKKTLKDTLGNRKETAKRLQISMRKLRYLLNEKSESHLIE
jgi:two-component system NtrC family response regulator